MRVLVGCEESQIVTREFRKRGHEAYSCDLIDTSGDVQEWHIKQDIRELLSQNWDLIIAFPPCTYLASSGNRWFNEKVYGESAIERKRLRQKAILLVKDIYDSPCPLVAIENPVGYLSKNFRKPSQIIEPYFFGDPHKKRTCLWLKGLPSLVPTNIIKPLPKRRLTKNGREYTEWEIYTSNVPLKDRAKVRSKTFPGIAKAMAEQWG